MIALPLMMSRGAIGQAPTPGWAQYLGNTTL